ncbi:MAG TPA: FAD-dependent monooxygenase, partial [Terriglobales bacterium]|nr:FAD-dependent monooxygenase [Terriglobales bacterium]
PCLGQGMCSGMRDAANLSWKLDLVLRDLAGPRILDSYEIERRPHVKAWADLSLNAGELICVTDPAKAAARDAQLRLGARRVWRPPPTLTTGLLDGSSPGGAALSGQLFPQRRIHRHGRSALLDELVGTGFLLVARSDPLPHLAADAHTFLQRLHIDVTWLSDQLGDSRTFKDETGQYSEYFSSHNLTAVIVRPDRYVYGGVRHLGDLTRLVQELSQLLQTGSLDHFIGSRPQGAEILEGT